MIGFAQDSSFDGDEDESGGDSNADGTTDRAFTKYSSPGGTTMGSGGADLRAAAGAGAGCAAGAA